MTSKLSIREDSVKYLYFVLAVIVFSYIWVYIKNKFYHKWFPVRYTELKDGYKIKKFCLRTKRVIWTTYEDDIIDGALFKLRQKKCYNKHRKAIENDSDNLSMLKYYGVNLDEYRHNSQPSDLIESKYKRKV